MAEKLLAAAIVSILMALLPASVHASITVLSLATWMQALRIEQPMPNLTPMPTQGQGCCRVCTRGKPCGDSCIARNKTCRKGHGAPADGQIMQRPPPPRLLRLLLGAEPALAAALVDAGSLVILLAGHMVDALS